MAAAGTQRRPDCRSQGHQRTNPRDISFCGHAILVDDIFVIPDALEDPRFADNPLVVNDPHIRFYAGCPIRAPDGQKVGTLCIIDREPRVLDTEELEVLADLAAMVEREFSTLQLATIDELTNISNRRGFMLLAQHSLHLCRREHLPATLVFMDFNKLMPINDIFGHAEGDRVLADFARQLAHTFRDADIVARLGGDEFAVLLTNHGKDATEHALARFRHALDHVTREADRGYEISFAHGVVEFKADRHRSVEDLLADGDTLMYHAKRSR